MHSAPDKSSKYLTWFFLLAILASVTYLLYYYRGVGLHDGYVYLKAGGDIVDRKNPYISGDTRSGTASSLLIFLFFSPFMNFASTSMFQIINLAGVTWFAWVIAGRYGSRRNFLLLILLTLWISPVREMLAINQVNGIILGLVASFLQLESKQSSRKPWLYRFLASFPLAMALDLKPHLLVIFIIAWSILTKSKTLIVLTFSQLVPAHLIIDIYIGEIVEISWLERLNSIKQTAGTNSLGDSVTIWPIITRIFPGVESLVTFLALVSFLVAALCSFYFASKRSALLTLLFSFTAPAFYIYFHFYDLIPVAILFLSLVIKNGNRFPDVAIVSLLLIPKEFTSFRNLTLVFMLTLLLNLISYNPKATRISKFAPIPDYLLYAGLCILNAQLFVDARLTQSIFVTEILMLLIWRISERTNGFISQTSPEPKSQ